MQVISPETILKINKSLVSFMVISETKLIPLVNSNFKQIIAYTVN